jgi:hypothetical protein
MEVKTITLPVKAHLASFYEQASPETQLKLRTLFEVLLDEMSSPDSQSLSEIMDAISDKAQERGLTPEILDDILNDQP